MKIENIYLTHIAGGWSKRSVQKSCVLPSFYCYCYWCMYCYVIMLMW